MDDVTTRHEINALLTQIPDAVKECFDRYYQHRLAEALAAAPADERLGAANPYQCEQALLAALRREAEGRDSADGLGDVPIDGQVLSVAIPLSDPRVAPAAADADAPNRRAVLLRRAGLLGTGAVMLLSLWQIIAVLATPAPEAAALPTPVLAPAPAGALLPTATAAPVRADIGAADGTAFWFPVTLALPSDPPAVLRVVASTSALGGAWEPVLEEGTADWLANTFVNAVFCLPPALEPAVAALRPDQPLTLRTANGTVRRYQITAVQTVARWQTEVLAQTEAGLTLLVCGTDGEERTVVHTRFLPPDVGGAVPSAPAGTP
ncbi:MAG TPA: hypothetical protein VFS21_24125 [Roseiflexaceae bacterium]|nr:hypothetical protein [Roseiflexaceae bacterium]